MLCTCYVLIELVAIRNGKAADRIWSAVLQQLKRSNKLVEARLTKYKERPFRCFVEVESKDGRERDWLIREFRPCPGSLAQIKLAQFVQCQFWLRHKTIPRPKQQHRQH